MEGSLQANSLPCRGVTSPPPVYEAEAQGPLKIGMSSVDKHNIMNDIRS